MTESSIVLAVYGTLRRGERNDGFLATSTYLGHGVIRGRLHEMPRSDTREYAYPALVLDGPGPVVVELYHLPDDVTLTTIDQLEAFDPVDEAGSQYVRCSVPIVDGPVATAWAYVYNGSRHDLGETITHGDWVTFRTYRPD